MTVVIRKVLPEEVEEVKDLLKTGMESACKLNVPLLAEVSEATNWYDCK